MGSKTYSNSKRKTITDTNQQRRGSYKEENCDTPNVTIESKIFNILKKKSNINKITSKKIEDTNTRLQLQERENEEAEEKAPILLFKSSSKQQEATRKSTSPPPITSVTCAISSSRISFRERILFSKLCVRSHRDWRGSWLDLAC